MKDMKHASMVALILLALYAMGCSPNAKETQADIAEVDVTKEYAEKELFLQDIVDVEYVPLETTDEFITHGAVKAVGPSVIITANRSNLGDLFLFDRQTGKGIRKLNRMGQSGEEYTQASSVLLDEANGELFVNDNPKQKILVYDLEGNFRRSFPTVDSCYYNDWQNYDASHLLVYKGVNQGGKRMEEHVLINKQDGNLVQRIPIPLEQEETPIYTEKDAVVVPFYNVNAPMGDDWLLANPSTDTLYQYTKDGKLTPRFVRTPSIHGMEEQKFLLPQLCAHPYYFFTVLTKKFDLEKMRGFPASDIMYDAETNGFFSYTIYNKDYADKKLFFSYVLPMGQEVLTVEKYDAPDLVEANAEGKLSGELKAIADRLDEEANPVIVLLKRKK